MSWWRPMRPPTSGSPMRMQSCGILLKIAWTSLQKRSASDFSASCRCASSRSSRSRSVARAAEHASHISTTSSRPSAVFGSQKTPSAFSWLKALVAIVSAACSASGHRRMSTMVSWASCLAAICFTRPCACGAAESSTATTIAVASSATSTVEAWAPAPAGSTSAPRRRKASKTCGRMPPTAAGATTACSALCSSLTSSRGSWSSSSAVSSFAMGAGA
mmetsp:Transcript_61326/g.193202  ORF Transcript_61326/g.193202 Transcript_61326/m.193202 type:complete len:218 (-) Transcript_61326:79-732(-)